MTGRWCHPSPAIVSAMSGLSILELPRLCKAPHRRGNSSLAVAAIALLELVGVQLAASVVAAVRAHGRRACARRWLRAMVSCMAFQSLRELHDAGRLMHHWNALIHQDALARGLLDLFWSSDF